MPTPKPTTKRRKPTRSLEIPIQRAILDWLTRHQFFVWRVNNVGVWDEKRKRYRKNNGKGFVKGVADIMGCLADGRTLAIEVKSRTGRVTPEQHLFLENVRVHGGVAFVARSLDDVIVRLTPYWQVRKPRRRA